MTAARTSGASTCTSMACSTFALEDTKKRIQRRLWSLADTASASLRLMTEAPRLGEGLMEELGGILEGNPDIGLVIIDTLQMVRNPSVDSVYAADYSDVAEFKKFADNADIALILVHHTRKMRDPDVFNIVSGSTGVTGAARVQACGAQAAHRRGDRPRTHIHARAHESMADARSPIGAARHLVFPGHRLIQTPAHQRALAPLGCTVFPRVIARARDTQDLGHQGD